MDPVFFMFQRILLSMLGLQMICQCLLAGQGKTTHWTQAFVAFPLMNSLNVMVHPFLAFVGFKTIFIWAAFLHNR